MRKFIIGCLALSFLSATAARATPEPQSNPEMETIFKADQAARETHGTSINWSTLIPKDTERRRRVSELLKSGDLHSGEDYYRAAFVFQHGTTENDYLLAHVLAMVSVKKGYPNSLWIAAATLDRFLMTSDHPQVFGTQFKITDAPPHATQEPYDRTLISDALRSEFLIPTLAEQEIKRQALEIQSHNNEPSHSH